jgi:DNA-binding Lrp family transcriptional regulator
MVLEPSMKGRIRADSEAKMREFVRAIGVFGPDISKVSDRMGLHRETARYWYKTKLLAKGFAVQAAVAYERLGLKYVVMVVDFEDGLEEYVKPILWAMSESCYVRYYNRTLPNSDYVVHAIVPQEHVGNYTSFVQKLRDIGIFRSVEVFVADWHRNVPMRVDSFDFEHGVWDLDWANLTVKYHEKDDVRPRGVAKFDRLDLEILKQLQLDADTTLTAIAAKSGNSMKSTQYHFQRHVVARGLIRNYRMNWLGTRYDYSLEKAMHRRHRQLLVNLLATGLTERERMEVRGGLNQFPCLWAEAAGEGFYYAEVAFPSEAAAEGYAALAKALNKVRRKYTLHVVDHTNAIGFTLNPQLYDSADHAWQFRSEDLLPKFEGLVLKIKQTS